MIWDLILEILDYFKFDIWDLDSRFEIWDLRFDIDFRFQTRDLRFDIWNFRFKILDDLRFETIDLRFEIWYFIWFEIGH